MSRVLDSVPRVALFLAGVAAGAIGNACRDRRASEPSGSADLQKALADLEARAASREAAADARMAQIEARLDEHAGKLAEMPSTTQIISAMEMLLSKTMASLDDRLTTQANSIEVLKTTVSQTDSLLERVLESLDSLQAYAEPELADEPVLSRPSV